MGKKKRKRAGPAPLPTDPVAALSRALMIRYWGRQDEAWDALVYATRIAVP